MSFTCFVFSIGKNVSYISLGTGPFALGTPLFTGGADSVETPLIKHSNVNKKFILRITITNEPIFIKPMSFERFSLNLLQGQ